MDPKPPPSNPSALFAEGGSVKTTNLRVHKFDDTTVTTHSVHFDNMSWPNPAAAVREYQRKLRYNEGELTKENKLYIASILMAYRSLIYKTQKQRNKICQKIRSGEAKRGVELMQERDKAKSELYTSPPLTEGQQK